MNEQEKQALLTEFVHVAAMFAERDAKLAALEERCSDQQTRIEELEHLIEVHTDEIRLINHYGVNPTHLVEED